MSTTVTMKGTEVIAALEAASMGLQIAIVAELRASSQVVRKLMSEKAPKAVGAQAGRGLADTIGIDINPTGLLSEIKPTMPYADAVETGSRPHMPPHGPDSSLAAWAKLKGINVYAVANSIAKKGTKPHPYIVPTYDEVQPEVGASFAESIGLFMEGIFA